MVGSAGKRRSGCSTHFFEVPELVFDIFDSKNARPGADDNLVAGWQVTGVNRGKTGRPVAPAHPSGGCEESRTMRWRVTRVTVERSASLGAFTGISLAAASRPMSR